MRDRKLPWAINEEDKRIFINDLKSEEDKKKKYFCPHCFQEVIPKQGEKKIWHFAHKGEECEFVKNGGLKTKDKKTVNSSLDSFMQKTTTIDKFEFEESEIFTCPLCRREKNREEFGMEWSKGICICKLCYTHLTDDQIEKLEQLEKQKYLA